MWIKRSIIQISLGDQGHCIQLRRHRAMLRPHWYSSPTTKLSSAKPGQQSTVALEEYRNVSRKEKFWRKTWRMNNYLPTVRKLINICIVDHACSTSGRCSFCQSRIEGRSPLTLGPCSSVGQSTLLLIMPLFSLLWKRLKLGEGKPSTQVMK